MFKASAYTVESVTAGHPDKICDQISDAILDACIKRDPNARVAVETFGGHGLLVIGGEITTRANHIDPVRSQSRRDVGTADARARWTSNGVDFAEIARKVYREIGHKDDLKILTNVVKQSPDISQGVDTGGAGDQGIMYGYACDETPGYLPLALVKVHQLAAGLEKLRKESRKFSWLKPDGKTQITAQNGKIKSVLVSAQHDENIAGAEIKKLLIDYLVKPFIGDVSDIEILVNPTGKFAVGGFEADTGLTGRKLMVDTYGGLIPHGGGCFSGKDPTKVDRSAAYMARFAAKNIVANGLTKECLVSVAYAIGRAEPLMVEAIDEKGKSLTNLVKEKFDFRPQAIIERLNLRRPIYQETAAYGHFTKPHLPWEKIISL